MRVLFPLRRLDTKTLKPRTHVEYYFYQALVENGCDVFPVGPFIDYPSWLEYPIKRLHNRIMQGNYVKDPLQKVWRISSEVNEAERHFKPDVVFAVTSPPFVFYKGQAPYVVRADSFALSNHYATRNILRSYSKLALRLVVWEEIRVLTHCAKIITHSDWSKGSLIREYCVPSQKIVQLPLAAPLPDSVIVSEQELLPKSTTSPLHLLFVGREPYRKGLDIAIETVNLLNEMGIHTEIDICGIEGYSEKNIRYIGFLDKTIDDELQEYVQLYKSSHFLIHPARFEPYGQVTSEAAAFGTPVVTNNVGGLSSAVTRESGIVLPAFSPASAYAEAISRLWLDPSSYHTLCTNAYRRFVSELSWTVLGKRLTDILEAVVHSPNQH